MKYKVVIETKSRSLCGTVTAQLEPTYKHVSIPSGAYATPADFCRKALDGLKDLARDDVERDIDELGMDAARAGFEAGRDKYYCVRLYAVDADGEMVNPRRANAHKGFWTSKVFGQEYVTRRSARIRCK